MKKYTVGFVLFLAFIAALAEEPGNCSTFLLKSDSVLFVGHNLDETPGFHVPGIICINKRNICREGISWYELIASPEEFEKTLLPFEEKPDPKISWISKYGSVTFNSEGIDFPDGGINEKGLAIFEMSLRNTKPKYDSTHPTLFKPLWIQYQLDNCSTLDEVIRNAHEINLQGWSWHYFVSDIKGNCAIIEFLKGEPIIHKYEEVPIPVLCNTHYSAELERMDDYEGVEGWFRTILRDAPRFVRANDMLNEYDPSIHPSAREYALEILDEIKIDGWNKWGILIDVRNMVVYVQTEVNRKLRNFSLNDFDFADGRLSQMIDIHSDLSGDISAGFVDYTYQSNLDHNMERAEHLFIDRFKGLIDNGISAEIYARRFADYSGRMRSLKNSNADK
nr:linear amide C-N hydrolase [Bacteroidota bacterium]